MRKGLRFQTKLTLSMVVAIAVVTFAILSVTESKVKQTYERQFERYFGNQVATIEKSGAERSGEFIELCRELASTDLVRKTLSGDPSEGDRKEFRRIYFESLREMDEKPIANPIARGNQPLITRDLLSKVGLVAVMNLDGEVSALEPEGENNRRFPKRQLQMRRNGSAEELRKIAARDSQQILYLPFTNSEGKSSVQEMVSTPVSDPATGETIGFFLRSTPAENEAQRLLERYYEEFDSDSAPVGGIFLDGQAYSRSFGPEFSEPLSAAIRENLDPTAAEPGEISFESEISGTPYRVYLARLQAEEILNQAYQVTAFPLTSLRESIAELRIQGSGIGLFGLLVGFLVATLLSRKLSVPLRALSAGTGEIRKGNLDHRVEVRSGDEIGELAGSFNQMAEELKQKAIYRELLGKVSDESVAQAMIGGELDLELGGELKTVSILFCDIRGFTAMTEEMHPTAVIEMLNQHMTAMTAVVRKHYGVVDKFVGDEIMAVFGGLKSYGNDAANAAACALEMISERERLNRELDQTVEIGIGVATGEVVAGCMGSTDRLNYTVLGAKVNLAARLCGSADAMEIVADEETVRAVGDSLSSEPMPDLHLKGISKKIAAYRIRSADSAPLAQSR